MPSSPDFSDFLLFVEAIQIDDELNVLNVPQNTIKVIQLAESKRLIKNIRILADVPHSFEAATSSMGGAGSLTTYLNKLLEVH
jgi:hypothetical protein